MAVVLTFSLILGFLARFMWSATQPPPFLSTATASILGCLFALHLAPSFGSHGSHEVWGLTGALTSLLLLRLICGERNRRVGL